MSHPLKNQTTSKTHSEMIEEAGTAHAGMEDGIRIDAPHAFRSAARTPTPQVPAEATSPEESRIGEQDLLFRASKLAEQLRVQFLELDRREQALNTQLTQFDRDQRTMRLQRSQLDEEIHQREREWKRSEEELRERFNTCEDREASLREQETALEEARLKLEQDRANLRQDLQKELDKERNGLRKTQESLITRREELELEYEHHKRKLALREIEIADQLEDERRQLHSKLQQEFELRQNELKQQQQDWEIRQKRELQELHQEREKNEQAFAKAQEELAGHRQLQRLEIEQLKANREARLKEQRLEFENSCLLQQQQLNQERVLLENRIRFQQEHLQKTRQLLEQDQKTFRQDHQQFRAAQEQWEKVFLLRMDQLERYRKLLDQREASLLRQEKESLGAIRVREEELDRERTQLRVEQKAWSEDQKGQKIELRRQRDMLALHTENLEGRRSRLDHLRQELEETHRTTLEMRLAIEDAWAKFTQTAGTELAREKVDASRRDLLEFHESLRQSIEEERTSLTQSVQLFQQQKEEFRDERRKLMKWIEERDDALRIWEEQLQIDAANQEGRETDWKKLRERWMKEKSEAESVIRDLLRQLSLATSPKKQPLPGEIQLEATIRQNISELSRKLREPDKSLDPRD